MVTQNKQTRNLSGGFTKIEAGKFETTEEVNFDDFTLGPNTTIILKHNLTVNKDKTFTNNGTVIIEPGNKIINKGNYINNGTTDSIESRQEDASAAYSAGGSAGSGSGTGAASSAGAGGSAGAGAGTAGAVAAAGAAAGSLGTAIAVGVVGAVAVAAAAVVAESETPTPTPAPATFTIKPSYHDDNNNTMDHKDLNENSFSLGKTNEYIDDLKDILDGVDIPTGDGILKDEMTLEKAALQSLYSHINNTDNNKSNDTILSQTDVKDNNYNNSDDKNTVIGNNALNNYNEDDDNFNIIVGDNNLNTAKEKNNNVIFGVNNNFKLPANNDDDLTNNTIFGFGNNSKSDSIIFSNTINLTSYKNKAVIGYGAKNLISKFSDNDDSELLINSDLLPANNKKVDLGSLSTKFNNISVKKLNNNLTLGDFVFRGANNLITLNSQGVINFENLGRNLKLKETRNTFNSAAWFSDSNGKTDLGKNNRQFKNLYLSNGIKIKNQDVIEYPFTTIDKKDESVGVVLNGLVINSNISKSKNLSNGNITSNDIINSGGRLSIPANKTLKFTETAEKMISNLKLDEDGDYIENIFISGPNINILNNKIINSNKVTANNPNQYVFTYHNILNGNKPSKTITNDSSVNMIIRRINNEKIEVAFRNTNQSSGY